MKDRIKFIRNQLNLSQDEFAAKMGRTRGVVTNLEYGKTVLSDLQIPVFCETFNVNEQWLRTGDGEPFVTNTKDNQLSDFVGEILLDSAPEFKKRLVSILASLDEDEWALLEKMAEKLVNEK